MNSQPPRSRLPELVTPRNGRGLVVAAFPSAAEAGAIVLRSGGNAIDAACAAAWALSVCEPAESGLGGQTTMLVRLRDGTLTVIDGHSHAPTGVTRAVVRRKAQRRGIRSMTVPSTPITLAEAQRRYGRLTLSQTLAPAIALAQDGYVITRLQRRLLKWTLRFFSSSSPESALFLKADGGVYSAGEAFKQPLLAATLRRLSEVGVRDFYEGQIAVSIVADMQARGGLVTARDLRELALPVEREPMEIRYREHRVVSIPPPGGGTQVLLALRILAETLKPGCEAGDWHAALAEATRAAFRERERWPDHPSDVTPSLAGWMVSAERAERIVQRMRSKPALPTDIPRSPESRGESGNTTHLCAADGEGNVVSLTQSIQSVFGSKVAHPTLGFVYNNYLSTCPRTPHPYRLGPGSLPQSNAAPTLVLDASGEPVLALGSAGSRRITSSVVQVVSAVLDRGERLGDAVAAPRAHALLGRTVWVEKSAPAATIEALAQRAKKIRLLAGSSYKLGAVHAIGWTMDGLVGAADPRRDGAAAHA